MPTGKMHANYIETDVSLVGWMLSAPFPHLPIEPVDSTGTDNAIYRLHDDMVVRAASQPPSWPGTHPFKPAL